MPPLEWEPILWSYWIRHYWIEEVSLYEPKLFIQGAKHEHTPEVPGSETPFDTPGAHDLTTRFFAGPGGYVYMRVLDRHTNTPRDTQVFKLKKDIP